ncbi:hypothetical protein VPHK227_0018 [Vibrio phage K227]
MWSNDTQNFVDMAEANPARGTVETGAGMNFDAAVADEIASGLSISEYIMKAPMRERNAKIDDLMDSDPELAQFKKERTYDPYSKQLSYDLDYDKAADYLIERGDEGFQSTAELNEQIQESVKQSNEYRKRVNENSNLAGMAGDFGGSFVTQAIEPVNYVAVIPGIGQATSMAIRTIVGATEGAIASAMVQPKIKEWKNANDVEYTTKDVLMDIGLSAVFGAGISGLQKFIGDKISGVRANKNAAVDADGREAFQAAEDRLADFEHEAKQADALGEDMTGGEYFDKLDDMAKALARGEDTWQAPPTRTPLGSDVADEQAMYEQALGVTRKKPETPEGVEADPDALDIVEIADESIFDFEIDGIPAATLIRGADADTKKINDTLTCMMGGGNA